MNPPLNALEQQSSCGIKKIIDCKVEGGQQMYKVKWEPTWEPAQNLVHCRHLVDEFWSNVNKWKINEQKAEQCRKQMCFDLDTNNRINNDMNLHRLTTDSKADIQQLIAQTNTTPVGSNTLVPPSNMLMSMQENSNNGFQTQPFDRKVDKSKASKSNIGNVGLESSPSSKMGMSSLKYLENFDNPYVKAIVVCRICNKEQSLKFVSNWKPHFLTHSDQKPHTCPHCPKGFLRPDRLRNHIKLKHGDPSMMGSPKIENNMAMKEEDFF